MNLDLKSDIYLFWGRKITLKYKKKKYCRRILHFKAKILGYV